MADEAKLITADILQEVVAKDFQCPMTEVQIVDFNCSHGSNKGENFTCILVRMINLIEVVGIVFTISASS